MVVVMEVCFLLILLLLLLIAAAAAAVVVVATVAVATVALLQAQSIGEVEPTGSHVVTALNRPARTLQLHTFQQ